MRQTVSAALCAAVLLGLALWQRGSAGETPPSTAPADLVVRGSVRSIQLPDPESELPPAPGRETTQLYCGMCHTNRYITIQPPLSRETWLAEVTKMRKAFNGPIPEEKVGEIIDYLMFIRGSPMK